MADDIDLSFLGIRLKELRKTEYDYSMDDMIRKLDGIGYRIGHKSTLSRVESGSVGEKTALEIARKYCEVFGMSDIQTEQFLRGIRIAIPDTSALLKNTHLIEELTQEYSKVVIPSIVIDELVNIKNNFGQKYSKGLSRRAWEAENSINHSAKAITVEYHGDKKESNEDRKIICIAQEISNQYHCKVDILTDDIDYSAYLKGHEAVSALHMREYLATKQGLVNMERLLHINDYYSDSYDELEVPTKKEINAYFPDGTTLLISCVKNFSKPINQRKEKIRWLIRNGADINKRESSNKYLPALSHSILKDEYEMFEFLLDECGADPNAGSRNPFGSDKVRQNNEGNTPLMIAAWCGKSKYVKKLCEHEDISINQQDWNGFTALIKACTNGYGICRDILIKAGADTRILDIDGKNYQDHWDEQLRKGPLRDRFRWARQKNLKNGYKKGN